MMPYIINVALIIAGCLVFYKILLRKETFYRLNRFLLIGCLAIAFALPLLPVPQQFSFRKKDPESTLIVPAPASQQPVESIEPVVPTSNTSSPSATTDNLEPSTPATDFSFQQVWKWAVWIYWFGVIAFGFNFLLQVIILIWKSRRHPVIIDGKFRIIEINGDKAPCSFGNYIFINPEKYEWDTYNQILQHEKVHVRQKHTLDILFAELMLVFQWFNPFAWIYRREMENNLEFLTDDQLTQKENIEPTSYQMSLLKVSVPHFPLSVTTNYNQSILKKRIAMMNRKRSNLHTAWKYFFLLPVLALFACLLNEPKAQTKSPGKSNNEVKNKPNEKGMDNEGYWFAIIKGPEVSMSFSEVEISTEDVNFNTGRSHSTFKLSELSGYTQGTGTFRIIREAGTMELTGRFENNTGMGRYKFQPDKAYTDYMSKEVNEPLDDDDMRAFFFIDIKKDYVQLLKKEGFTTIDKDDLIPMAALHVDAAFIRSIKDAGYKDVSMEDLIPLKAMNINKEYIEEIKSSGYNNISLDKLVSFKAQGIGKEYIMKMKNAGVKTGDGDDGDDLVAYKALDITEEFANSFKSVGLNNISRQDLITFKSLGITPEYVKSFQDAGFKNIDANDLPGLKAQGVTPEYIRSFERVGFKINDLNNIVGLKAVGVTPEYIKSFYDAGYKNIDFDNFTGLKSLGVTPEFGKEFEKLGFKNIDAGDLTALKATGVTPEYITTMRGKGFNYTSLQKYITLKSLQED